MSTFQILLVTCTVFLLSVGQVLFKLASSEIVLTLPGIIPSLLSLRLLLALFVYFFATILWLVALKDIPLRIAYPFAALAFFIVPTLAHFALGETLSWNTYAGAAVIALGVFISIYQ